MEKLSKAQQMFMTEALTDKGNRTPNCGQRDSGRHMSAWHRTADSLMRRGLVTVQRLGNAVCVAKAVRTSDAQVMADACVSATDSATSSRRILTKAVRS